MEGLKASQNSRARRICAYSYLRVDGYPVALTGWFHLSPGSSFAPYFRIGGGIMPYTTQDRGQCSGPR